MNIRTVAVFLLFLTMFELCIVETGGRWASSGKHISKPGRKRGKLYWDQTTKKNDLLLKQNIIIYRLHFLNMNEQIRALSW